MSRETDTGRDVDTPPDPSPAGRAEAKPGKDRVRQVTMFVLALCAVVFVWYLISDRLVPFTDQAQIRGVSIPITPQVSGYLSQINVRLHSIVEEGDLLFQIDRRTYDLAVKTAEANVDLAAQQAGAATETVKSAAARLGVARAQLDRSQRNYNRTRNVLDENPGALSQADWDRTETSLSQSTEKVASAEADLEKAKQQLGDSGPSNAQVRAAVAALEQAQLNLAFTEVYAPYGGAIESFNVDVGYFASAGHALSTLVSGRDLWIQANMRENNLGNIDAGDPVEFTLDAAPGKVFSGSVRSVGYGVEPGSSANPGGLPKVTGSQSWLEDPQRFPVIIGIDNDEASGFLRLGGTANVVVYTGDNGLFNSVAKLGLRVRSVLSYVR